jgi:hypothetical protein
MNNAYISVVPAGYPPQVRVPGNPRVQKFEPVTLPVPAGMGSENDGYGYGYTQKYPWVTRAIHYPSTPPRSSRERRAFVFTRRPPSTTATALAPAPHHPPLQVLAKWRAVGQWGQRRRRRWQGNIDNHTTRHQHVVTTTCTRMTPTRCRQHHLIHCEVLADWPAAGQRGGGAAAAAEDERNRTSGRGNPAKGKAHPGCLFFIIFFSFSVYYLATMLFTR